MIRRLAWSLATVLALLLLVAGYNVVRHVLFWSPTEQVQFESGAITLAGTLVHPAGTGPFPAIVMLHGSGPEPRFDPTGRAVANALVRRGFAVLAYDKRGVGDSEGDFDAALYRDFIDDALAAMDFLASRAEVDAGRLGLYSVSESGWFAPEIASRRDIRIIINKVAPVLSRSETGAWEVRNEYIEEGVPPATAQRMADFALTRWRYYIATARDPALASGPQRDALERELSALRSEVAEHADLLPESIWAYDAEAYAAFAADAAYDPRPWLESLSIPQFYAYGGADVNVPTERCLPVLQRLARRPGADITVKVYPGLNHGLMTPAGLFHVGFPPDYLATIGDWAASKLHALPAGGRSP